MQRELLQSVKLTAFRSNGRSCPIASLRVASRSLFAQISSGYCLQLFRLCLVSELKDSAGFSNGTSRHVRFLRTFIRAALMAMRVSQVPNLALPSKLLRWR